jgi:hypothetical protein
MLPPRIAHAAHTPPHTQVRRHTPAALTLAALPLFAACSTAPTPSVEVVSATIRDQTADGAVILFTIEATNPSTTPLPLKRLDYTIDLDGKPLFTAARVPLATLAAGSKTTLTLPAALTPDQIRNLPINPAYRFTGLLIYSEPGPISEFLFDSGISQPEVGFSGAGTVRFGEER